MSPSASFLRSVVTSSPPNTIWSRVSEDAFRTHLVYLEERTNAVPIDVVNCSAHVVDNRGLDDGRLPLQVEQQIADDFAFIAAIAEGAQSVAAVCLERHIGQDGSTLFVRVAGMDAVDENVRRMLADIASVLHVVSKRAVNDDMADLDLFTDQLFVLIANRHKQKLLGRLRSNKWKKPKHLSLTHKKPLWQDFKNVIHRVQHIYPRKSERKARNDTEQQLIALQKIYEAFEMTEDNEDDQHLQLLIRSTYTFCRNVSIRKFAAKLESVGTTSQIAAALKTLHQLEKVGAYWRVARSFVEVAREYSEVFSNVKLEYLTPYAGVPTSIAYESWAKTCHVHAEVQLVVDYALRRAKSESSMEDTRTTIIWPSTIGTSKYLCYLCYLFLKYYGDFLVLNTHGRLYDQWTVPDLEEYDEQTRATFAHVLEQMDEHVCKQIEAMKESMWRAEPMTSRQNLLCLGSEDEDVGKTVSEVKRLAVK